MTIVVRDIESEELRVCETTPDTVRTLRTGEGYTWGGPFPSERDARLAIAEKRDSLRAQLYPENN